MSDRKNGLYEKYTVTRNDGKPLKGGCVVLEWGDPNARAGIMAFSIAAHYDGYKELASGLRSKLSEYGGNKIFLNLPRYLLDANVDLRAALTTAQARIAELEGERDAERFNVETATDIDAFFECKVADLRDNHCACDQIADDGGECPNCHEAFMLDQLLRGYRKSRADTAEAQVERLTEGLRDIRCVLGDFQEEWSAREASVDKIAKAALTPDGKGG